jgi:hypothetical protein
MIIMRFTRYQEGGRGVEDVTDSKRLSASRHVRFGRGWGYLLAFDCPVTIVRVTQADGMWTPSQLCGLRRATTVIAPGMTISSAGLPELVLRLEGWGQQ